MCVGRRTLLHVGGLQRAAERLVAVAGDLADVLALDQVLGVIGRVATRVRGTVGRIFLRRE